MKRESYCEAERMKRMHKLCGWKRQRFDQARLRRMIQTMLDGNIDELKRELCNMYTWWELTQDEQIIRNMRITEWVIDVYTDLRSKRDRQSAVSSMIVSINREIKRYDDLGFFKQTLLLHDIVLVFTHELGKIREGMKTERKSIEYISDEDIINEKRALNLF